MFLALKFPGTPAPLELAVWTLAERFHWTLDEVEGLTVAQLHELELIDEARGKARSS